MKTILKSSFLTFLAVLFSAIIFSFSNNEKNYNAKKYGGTASVTVEVDFASTLGEHHPDVTYLKTQGIKNGQRRVVEVSTNCNESSYSDAQKALQNEISYKKKNYEKTVSSIRYDISSCD